ncbi:Aldehyde/histidinol dehydrogenase [Crucibulum laeve]|uniref:Aldehyde/histidinol dehydrogenase n=1 Tax=Crucibulum laeve TaxID=68775 RepID=A0A5C3LLE0_9AGAR|nr:Aldehyde/histidinol dehydrogenase [Crucibulum laeve]
MNTKSSNMATSKHTDIDLFDLVPYTSLEEIEKIHASLYATFRSHLTIPIAFRIHQLHQLARMAQENAPLFAKAVYLDLGRPEQEAYMAEIGPIVQRSLICARDVREWVGVREDEEGGEGGGEKVYGHSLEDRVQEWQRSWKPRVRREARGVACVISPWNYPMMLSLQPLYGAIAAGCCVLIKLSEIAPHYASLLSKLLPRYLDERAYKVVLGEVKEVERVLELKWDSIFYTGNSRIARLIAAAAAKHLTPCTLELGGKSPVILDENLAFFKEDGKMGGAVERAARRVLWGKINNAGQICVTPDYVLCPRSLLPLFLPALRKTLATFFPDGALNSNSFSRVVSLTHWNRLKDLLRRSEGEIVAGGGMLEPGFDQEGAEKGNRTQRGGKLEPTVVIVKEGDSLLEGEIFGPILPILVVDDVDHAIQYINSKPHPLVLYMFTEDEQTKERILNNTTSGNVCINDTFQQMAVNELPFGGVGESGYGRQVLKNSFDLFTYERAVVDVPKDAEPVISARYPPYTTKSFSIMASSAFLPIPESSPPPERAVNSRGVVGGNGHAAHPKNEHGLRGLFHRNGHTHTDDHTHAHHNALTGAPGDKHQGLGGSAVGNVSGAGGGASVAMGNMHM